MSRIVTFGEIMGRLMTPGYQRFQQAMPGMLKATFAGAEASMAASIAYLGGEAALVMALPKHALRMPASRTCGPWEWTPVVFCELTKDAWGCISWNLV